MTTLSTLSHSKMEKNLAQSQLQSPVGVNMNRVATIILGGGQGSRLAPLTITRCKPAICFGGKYRLIDIPMSNAINAGCSKIFIITQFLSSSLHQHVSHTYRLGSFSSGFIDLLSAEQKPSHEAWFQGTADAVRQNLNYFIETPVDYFLILSGDQLYNMDFQKMLRFAQATDADLTVAALPVNENDAKRMGILQLNENGFVTEFCEKPQDKEVLKSLRLPKSALEQNEATVDDNRPYLGSMGIYLFKRKALLDLLNDDPREDFGKHLLPTKVKQGGVAAYLYDGYWEDIGTIESFYNANIALTRHHPDFNCYDEGNPIFASHHNLPAPKISNTHVIDSIICEGSIVEADKVKNSILGPRSVVKKGTLISNTYVMGNDFYAPPVQAAHLPAQIQIGEDCIIERAILDKNIYLGKGVRLINKNKLQHYDGNKVFIRDGVIVVSRGASLPDGFVL